MFPEFVKAGIAVFSFDAHGHGDSEPTSEGKKGFVNRFQDLVGATTIVLPVRAPANFMRHPTLNARARFARRGIGLHVVLAPER